MLRNGILICLLFLGFLSVSGQKQTNNWLFGGNAGLSFSNYNPTPIFTNPYYWGGDYGCISDKNGNLLFYTNGMWVWNKNNVLMQNGTGLFGANDDSQNTIVIPQPGNDSIFYIFTPGSNLYYSTVNIKRNGGLGEVMAKNILLSTIPCQSKITAALHCNKKDIWVIVRNAFQNTFSSFLVNSNGVSTTPIISTTPHNSNGVGGETYGNMKTSPNAKLIATTYSSKDTVEVSRFNNSTGALTHLYTLCIQPYRTPPFNYLTLPYGYGVEFSPDSKKLYYNAVSADSIHFVQYNLAAGNPLQVQQSMQVLYNVYVNNSNIFSLRGMQLALDGKIYITTYVQNALSVINKPNVMGIGSQFVGNGQNIDDGSGTHIGIWGIVNFPVFFNYNPIEVIGNCQFSNISFNTLDATDMDSVKWDFGDPASGINNFSTSFNPTHIFSSQGQYLVKLITYFSNGCASDTFQKIVHAGPFRVDLGSDTAYCRGDSIRLRMYVPNAGVLWSNNSIDTLINISQPGTYWVRVNLGECVASDTIVVTENQLPQFSLGNDTIICNNANITLAPNPNYNNSTYLWSNATINNTNTVNTAGLHWLQLTDNKGCRWRDSINVSFKTLPNYNLGNDTAICQKDTITLNATVTGTTSYNWNTGATSPTIKAYTTNTYWCDVNKEGCIYRDSIHLTVKPLPIVNLGNDTTLCEDKTYLLNVTNPNSTYQWNNGTTNPTFNITQPGTYAVEVTMNGCKAKDTINIQYQLKPRFTLGADKLICPGLTFVLDPQMPPNSLIYQWQDGSGLPTYTVTTQGLYYVDISNECGPTRDSILITKGLCKVYIPTAFTPNNDGKNDEFKIGGGEAVKDFKLTVYNRWGQKLFETTTVQKSWNGTYQGKAQPTGTYIYYVTYKDATTNEVYTQKGTLMLLR